MWNGPVTIDLFCSLIFTLSITEIQLCKGNAHFPGHFAPIILANHVQFNVWRTSLARIEWINLKQFEHSNLKMWQCLTPWGVGPRNVGTMLMQDTKFYFCI